MEPYISAKTIQKISEELIKLQMRYPEIYKLMDEDPITLISDIDKKHTELLLEEYSNRLNALLTSLERSARIEKI